MRRRALLLATVLLALPLAGCADNGPTDGDDGETPTGPPAAAIPRWNLGDAWTYKVRTFEFPETTSTMLVYDDDGNNYHIGVTEEQQALVHALFNVNPQLGRIQKGNLAVYEAGEPRAMYRFPITDGDTWQTDLFVSIHGGRLNAEATWSDAIATGLGPKPGYEIVATNGQGFEVRYDYIPEIGWFSKLHVTDADGTVLHDLRVTGHQRERAGTAYFVRGDDLFEETFGPSGSAVPSRTTRNVLVDGASAEGGQYGPYDLQALNVQVTVPNANNDRAEVTIRDGNGDEVYTRSFLATQRDEFKFQTVRGDPGQWEITVTLSGGATATVRLAGAWSYSGTV